MSQWLQVFGRLHPMVLHLPIGLMIGLVTLEAFALLRRKPLPRDVTTALVWLAAAAAVFSAASGFVLSYEGTFSGDTLDLHLKLGIAVAIAATLVAILHSRSKLPAYRVLLFATAALLVPTGHLGASMTHGEGFLTAPLTGETTARRSVGPPSPTANADAAPETRSRPQGNPPAALQTNGDSASARDVRTLTGETPVPQTSAFAAIQQILESRCTACHSGPRAKGRLKLDSADGVRDGGKHGALIVAGKPDESLILRRLRLPADADGHMPPRSKPQPTTDELAAIEKWIAAGASYDSSPKAADATKEPSTDSASAATESPDAANPIASSAGPHVEPASPESLSALQAKFVHVERVAGDSNLLWIDFAAVAPTTTDADVQALLTPLLAQCAELALARTKITDASLPLIAKMPNLRRLDLRATQVGDNGASALRSLAHLEELVVAQTQLTDASIDSLLALPALKRIHLWKTAVSIAGLDRLRHDRPELQVIAGDEPEAAALEAEGELKYSSDAPLPGQAPVAAPTSLKAVNAKCPVTGAPVDPKFLVVYKGRVIGFCCPNCPKEFWTDPTKFESKIEWDSRGNRTRLDKIPNQDGG